MSWLGAMNLPSSIAHRCIASQIGAGGRAEVYCTTDTKFGRDVALKVLAAEMARYPVRPVRHCARIKRSIGDMI